MLLLLASLAYAGGVTATFPLPPGAITAFLQDTAGNLYLGGNNGAADLAPLVPWQKCREVLSRGQP
jgi:hypothetical protein